MVHHLLRQVAAKYRQGRKVLGERAWKQVNAYSWPGNIRELENVLERSFLFSRGPIIESIRSNREAMTDNGADRVSGELNLREITKRAAMDTEKEVIRAALERLSGNVSAVARQIGISPRAVHQKLRKHAIDPHEFRRR